MREEFTIPIQFYISEEEKKKLEVLCKVEHRNMSSLLRFLIHDAHDRRLSAPAILVKSNGNDKSASTQAG